MKVAYLGPHGTHSEEVCTHLYSKQEWEFVPLSTIDNCIRAVASKEVHECLVPIENSLEGSVNITMDNLAHEVNLFITREIAWPIRHHLLAPSSTAKITTVISHPQALAQCRQYLSSHYPHAKLQAADSTAEAAQLAAASEEGYAAIANLETARLYQLSVRETGIQDNHHNCTRFVSLSRNPQTPDCHRPAKTSVVCKILGNKPGSLCDILQEFVNADVNLVRIESRPARTGLGEYVFFLDMEGSTCQDHVRGALAAVRKKSLWLKNLGSYSCYTISHSSTSDLTKNP